MFLNNTYAKPAATFKQPLKSVSDDVFCDSLFFLNVNWFKDRASQQYKFCYLLQAIYKHILIRNFNEN